MRKIVGPSACPDERAHDVLSIVTLELEWSWSFKAEILVTAVTNWTLLYHACGNSYTTNNLGVPVKPFWYQSLFMYSTVNYDSHLKWRNTLFRLENKIEKQVILVQTKTKRVVRKGPLQVLGPISFLSYPCESKKIQNFLSADHTSIPGVNQVFPVLEWNLIFVLLSKLLDRLKRLFVVQIPRVTVYREMQNIYV